MLTYQMVGLADQNGKVYECKYGTYSKEDGFRFNDSVLPICEEKGWREIVNILFHEDMWKLKQDIKKMTMEDLEKELGYKVQIIDPQPEKKKVDDKHRKEVDKTVQFFKDFFGVDLDPEKYC